MVDVMDLNLAVQLGDSEVVYLVESSGSFVVGLLVIQTVAVLVYSTEMRVVEWMETN